MGIEVTIRVRNLDQEDLGDLRKWLEHHYPGHWEFRPGRSEPGSLGAGDDLLHSFVQGLGEGIGESLGTGIVITAVLLRKQIMERFQQIRKQYPEHDQPEIDIDASERDQHRPE